MSKIDEVRADMVKAMKPEKRKRKTPYPFCLQH